MVYITEAVELIISDLTEVAFGLVESLKRSIYSFDVMKGIDWTTMLLFFWIIFALIVYTVGNILFIVIKKKNSLISENSFSDSEKSKDHVNESLEKSCINTDVFADKQQSKQTKFAIATGPDSDCVQWVNNIIQWLYSQNDSITQSIINTWLTTLNSKNIKLSTHNGFSIEFVKIVGEQSYPPELSDVRVDLECNENITVTSKVSSPRILLLIKLIKENASNDEESLPYELQIERFGGKMKIVCINEESLLVVRFMERPDFKVTLKSLKTQQQTSDNRISENVIIDATTDALTKTVVDLCLSNYQNFPKFQRNLKNDLLLDRSPYEKTVERKLFVKVVKADNLGKNKGCQGSYCVIEVDEPSQRVETSIIKDNCSPVWNEHFIFNLEKDSSEVLFELYDKTNKGNDNFLGLGIVSVKELKTNPSQKQIIQLEPRPLEMDDVSGSLTVEFLFMEHSTNSATTPMSESNSSNVSPISCSPTTSAIDADKTPPLNKNILNGEDVMLILNDNSEESNGNESCLTELEIIEEQNSTSESQTDLGTVSAYENCKQQNNDNKNPFLQHLHDRHPTLLNEFNTNNPFLNEFKLTNFDRSLSCDNLSLNIPIIPPLIRRSSIPSLELLPYHSNQNNINSDFIGNPFDSLKTYRNEIFYSVPTHSIPLHLNHKEYKLPPTLLFPTYNKNTFSDTVSQCKLNHNNNPFVERTHSLTSSSSINSVIGIESSDSDSDKTLTDINLKNNDKNIKLANRDQIEIVCEKANFTKKVNKNSKRKKYHLNRNSYKHKLFDSYLKSNNNQINNVKNSAISGDGMAMHETVNAKSFDNCNDIEFSLTETNSKDLSNKPINNNNSYNNHLKVENALKKSEGSEGYGTSQDEPSINEGSMISSVPSHKSDDSRRSRSKEPRSIIRAIRKRFSFNKNRSKSVEIRTNKEVESASRDSSVSSTSDRARSMPGSREPSSQKDVCGKGISTLPRGINNKTDSFSNLSEISGISSKTFVHENSTLIIEANESGNLKHYVIPMSLANKNKWRRRGVKLHLYNDHLFVAKHLSGSITCQVCGKLFSRRPGKQGYQCRDCDYMSHKRCHIQVDVRCAKSTISSLKLECIVDPKVIKSEKNNVKDINNHSDV